MRRSVDLEHGIRQIRLSDSAPATQEQSALVGFLQCRQRNLGHLFRVAVRHAAEANVNRRRSCLQEIHQRLRRRPIRLIEEPVTGHVDEIAPVFRLGQHRRAVAIDDGDFPPHIFRERPLPRFGRQVQEVVPRLIDDGAHQLPEHLPANHVSEVVEDTVSRQRHGRQRARKFACGMQRLEIGVHIRDVPFGGNTVAEVVRRTRDDQSVRAFACHQRILHRLTHDGTHQAAKTTCKLERIALRFHPGASFFALHNRLWIAFQRGELQARLADSRFKNAVGGKPNRIPGFLQAESKRDKRLNVAARADGKQRQMHDRKPLSRRM